VLDDLAVADDVDGDGLETGRMPVPGWLMKSPPMWGARSRAAA
jgi:hypothetical protein